MRRLMNVVLLAVALTVYPWQHGFGAEAYLTYREGTLGPEIAKFLEQLTVVFQDITHHAREDFTAGDFRVERADLNGDGVDELFVYPATTIICGNRSSCTASIFRKGAQGWEFAGNVEAVGVGGTFIDDYEGEPEIERKRPAGRFVFIEDTWVNGWRVLNDGQYRRCWIPADTGQGDIHDDRDPPGEFDSLGWPYSPKGAGYFGWSDSLNEPCPHRSRK